MLKLFLNFLDYSFLIHEREKVLRPDSSPQGPHILRLLVSLPGLPLTLHSWLMTQPSRVSRLPPKLETT